MLVRDLERPSYLERTRNRDEAVRAEVLEPGGVYGHHVCDVAARLAATIRRQTQGLLIYILKGLY